MKRVYVGLVLLGGLLLIVIAIWVKKLFERVAPIESLIPDPGLFGPDKTQQIKEVPATIPPNEPAKQFRVPLREYRVDFARYRGNNFELENVKYKADIKLYEALRELKDRMKRYNRTLFVDFTYATNTNDTYSAGKVEDFMSKLGIPYESRPQQLE